MNLDMKLDGFRDLGAARNSDIRDRHRIMHIQNIGSNAPHPGAGHVFNTTQKQNE
jgi:hypothetical protein